MKGASTLVITSAAGAKNSATLVLARTPITFGVRSPTVALMYVTTMKDRSTWRMLE